MSSRGIFLIVLLFVATVPVLGQKIDPQVPDAATITRVATALNHLTVIELAEPVMSVAAGSQAFKVEWRGNKVFVQPTEPDVSTNLFIWTKSGRLNYELEPAGEVARMHFAIDQPPIPRPAGKAPAAESDPPGRKSAIESPLLGGTPVRMSAYKAGKNRVQLLIKDLFRRDDRLFIRYAVENSTRHIYEVEAPRVFFLESVRGPKNLIQLRNSQLTDSEERKLESTKQVSVDVIHSEVRSAQVSPGQETVGVVEVKLPAADRPVTVLRLVLPDSRQGQITASLVL